MMLASEITGSWKEKQIRQGCTCERWAQFSSNRSMTTETPHAAHHALLTTGKMDFTTQLRMTYPAMIEGLLATVPVQITYGMLLGKVGPSQLMLCSIMCVTSYGLNYWITMYIIGAWDHVGGSVIIHTFGAFFGLGCTMVASPSGSAENPDNSPRYNADVLCMVGVILNWMTFPSFNAYFAPVKAQQAVVVNTYLSQFSSCVAAMVFSSLLSGQFKLDPSDVQRSSIAGGVAISSVSSLFCQPWEAMLIGSPPSDLFSLAILSDIIFHLLSLKNVTWRLQNFYNTDIRDTNRTMVYRYP
jgi:ammonium transporter Rh